VAALVHRGHRDQTAATQPAGAASIALGYGLIAWGLVSLDLLQPLVWQNLFPDAFILAAGIAAVVVPRLGPDEAVAESI
jgi:hypothetical protein